MASKRKVFGIGYPKTGTSSLGIALKKLGFNHKSYDFELTRKVKSGDYESVFKEAEKYDSFEDAPWNCPNFYKELDRKFPDSKFILTVRDMQSWIRSHEQHFSVDGLRQIRKELWKPPYTEQRKAELIANHQQRIDNVLEYFKERPEDLLVINICNGEGWEKLCPFLNMPIRTDPFPRTNITSQKKQEKTLSNSLKQTIKKIFNLI